MDGRKLQGYRGQSEQWAESKLNVLTVRTKSHTGGQSQRSGGSSLYFHSEDLETKQH